MSKPMTLNVRLSSSLSDFVAANVGEQGAYENASEYVRDLIRKAQAVCPQSARQRRGVLFLQGRARPLKLD